MDPAFLLADPGFVLCDEDDPSEEIGTVDGFTYGTLDTNGGALTLDVLASDGRWYSKDMQPEPGWRYDYGGVAEQMKKLVEKYKSRDGECNDRGS